MTPPTNVPDRRRIAVLYAFVAAGSVVGGVTRYLVSLALATGPGLPWATLLVNVTGSFIIGFYGTLSGPEGRIFAGARQRQFIMTGFCGGYTTFSAFSLETFMLFRTGLSWTGWAYIAVSVTCWLLAVWLGHMLATRLNRLKGS
ncbi:fluoride efflux transporter CrcB [Bradyrhizobium sp.]|uniref:fluoride efflux transporter CrcB n=1 Tax=Bradyrhizobium sp. TaxID=376 RepID=UPI004037D02C